jgi:DNA-binding NarL/FixJ family response regulator
VTAGVAPRVVVADDHPAVLVSVCDALEAGGMSVVARVRDGNAAVDSIARERPDAAVVDHAMPGQTGIDVARRVQAASPGTAVVLFTGFGEPAMVGEALAAGVRGIVLKDAPLEDLVRAIHATSAGGTYVDGRLAGQLSARDAVLTERELATLRLLADGARNEQIGQRLSISTETVKVHVTKAMRKLGATTRTQAVAEALRLGLIR